MTALVAEYLAKYARKFKKSAAEDERILARDVLPAWGDRSVRDLTRGDIRALVEGIADRGAPVMANRTLAVIRRVLNFAIDYDWVEANPAARVRKPAPEVSRDRVLDDNEIRRLWRVLSHFPTTAERPAPGRKARQGTATDPICPINEPHAALLKLRLLTAQRGGEVALMRWRDLDLKDGWWTIPGAFTKNGKPHRVPLVDQATAAVQIRIARGAPPDTSAQNISKKVRDLRKILLAARPVTRVVPALAAGPGIQSGGRVVCNWSLGSPEDDWIVLQRRLRVLKCAQP